MIQYYQLFKIQEDQENNSINVLLDVGKDPKIPHGFMTPKEQRRIYKTADNPTKETSDLKSWKICEATRPHQLDYIPDDVFALQRQYHRSTRFLTGVPSLINLSKERKCGISENIGDNSTKKQKASLQADTSKSSTTQEGAYDFKSCPSTEGHIKRYRKEVTHKIMSDYMSVLLMESRTGEAVGKHGSYCCPHLLSVYKSKARQQKCITKASFICYNLNFEEQNGMKSELGCLRVGPVDSTCGCHKHALAQKSRGCSIPNITLPSMKEIVDFTANTKGVDKPTDTHRKPKENLHLNSRNSPNSPKKNERRSTTVLNYMRPKIPQAAMPKKEKSFYACIMPVHAKKVFEKES